MLTRSSIREWAPIEIEMFVEHYNCQQTLQFVNRRLADARFPVAPSELLVFLMPGPHEYMFRRNRVKLELNIQGIYREYEPASCYGKVISGVQGRISKRPHVSGAPQLRKKDMRQFLDEFSQTLNEQGNRNTTKFNFPVQRYEPFFFFSSLY